MKTHLYRTVLLAGVIVFGAAPGRAQALTASIPFAFRTSNAEMPPGEYSIRRLESGSPAILLKNRDTNKSDVVMTVSMSGTPSDAPPRMIFRCAENHCALLEVWGVTAGGGRAEFLDSRDKGKDRQHLAVVYLKGDSARR